MEYKCQRLNVSEASNREGRVCIEVSNRPGNLDYYRQRNRKGELYIATIFGDDAVKSGR